MNILRNAEKHVSPQAIRTTNLENWTKLIAENQYPYQMADVLVLYLMQKANVAGYRPIAEYYRLLGQGLDNEAAFQQAFGLASTSLDAGFLVWFVDLFGQPAIIEIIAAADLPPDKVAEVQRGIDQTRQFLGENWGTDLKSSLRLVLISGKPAFAAAMVKEFGFSSADAEQRVKNIHSWYSGSTAVLDAGSRQTKQQTLYRVSSLLMMKFTGDVAPQKAINQLFWLSNGCRAAASARIVALGGLSGVDHYRDGWLNTLSKATVIPELGELATLESWNEAVKKHGSSVVAGTAALAGHYLLDKYGATAFGNWLTAVKVTGSAEQAFQQTFGLTVNQFYEEFAVYLRANVRKTVGVTSPVATLGVM